MKDVFYYIIEKLENELYLADKEKERCSRENPLQFDSAKGYANGVANIIEIIKKIQKEYESDIMYNASKMYATCLSMYGVDISEKLETAVQNAFALEEAFNRGRQHERDMFHHLYSVPEITNMYLDNLHKKILGSKFAEYVTEKEIDALVVAKKITSENLTSSDWIPFTEKETDEDEKETYGCDMILSCKLPEEDEEILVTYKNGYVDTDTFLRDGYECYLDSGAEFVSEAIAWMPKPKGYQPIGE